MLGTVRLSVGNQGVGFVNVAYGFGCLLGILFGSSPAGPLPYITLGLMDAADVPREQWRAAWAEGH